MKFVKFFTLIVAAAAMLVGCEEPNNNNNNGPSASGDATLTADSYSVEVNTPITFTVVDGSGNDLTAESVIFDKTHDFIEVTNPYTPTIDGEYEFYAVVGTSSAITKSIKVTVLPSLPALPADAQPESTSFNHRILLVDHTGNQCGFCPKMMLALKEVEDAAAYHGKYYEAMSHTYNPSDPAYSATAAAISSYYGINSWPTLTYNFAYSTSSSYNSAHIKQQIDAQWKEVADAGIAVATSMAAEAVVVNAEVKAAVTNEYRITAWLLEDGIEAKQTNATEDWMNIHNNAIRQAVITNPISGYDLGTIEAGKSAQYPLSLKISSKSWKRENLKVMVIASAKNSAGKFEVVNVTLCPIDDSVSYDYKN